MNILNERGLFWWYGEPLADQQFAPDTAVVGHLTLDEHGLAHLELDGILPVGNQSPFPIVGFDPMIDGKSIQGILKGSNQHIRLLNLRGDGGSFSTRGISYGRYIAETCIVSDTAFPENLDISSVGGLDVNLKGFEEWLGLRSIEVTKEPGGEVSALYHQQDNLDYPLANGKLSIRHCISSPFFKKERLHTVTLKEVVFLEYTFLEKLILENTKAEYRLLEDLLILLTNSEYSLDWPSISLGDDERRYQLYFWRQRNLTPPPGLYECYPNFNLIRENFGTIFARWRQQRGELGPAIYLYLGLRRGQPIYVENRFVNLIWAVETFHRIKNPEHHTATKLRARAARILAKFTDEDLKWLTGKLKHPEPSLEDRIFETVSSLPLSLDKKNVRSFAKGCADRRNEISHHGGQRQGGNSSDFIADLEKKSDALEYLHHALLLQELQIGEKIASNYIFNNYKSYRIKHALVEVGLLNKSVLKPPDMPIPKLKEA